MEESKSIFSEKFRLGQTIELNGHYFQINNFVPEMDFMNLKLLSKKDGLKKRTTPPVVLRLNDILEAFQQEVVNLSKEGVPSESERWDDLRKGSLQALANSLPMFIDLDGEKMNDLLPDLVEDHFPKGKCAERGQAIVLAALLVQEILRMRPLRLKKE